ncbi:MAG: N-acetylneuraminate synthase family protein [Elusimicrobia bacterium]|nr:N-acetylneuraminate synthase family protein [Elusimicrobiota bacterium]
MTHDGSFNLAKSMVRAAAECGVDAVKLQAHIAEEETLPSAPPPPYFSGETRISYFKRTAFSQEQYRELGALARSCGVAFVASPFSEAALELLLRAGVEVLKVPSGEVTNTPLLRLMAATGLPVLLSSGMSSVRELDRAAAVLRRGRSPWAVLQCTSLYPCPYEKVGLNLLAELGRRYLCPVGLSDHTLTTHASLAAVTLGARILERHFTVSKKLYGPDARFSLEPAEMQGLVEGVRAVEAMLLHPVDKDRLCGSLKGMKSVFEKSVVSRRDIGRGEVIRAADVAVKKPGGGIPPDRLGDVVGSAARVEIPKDRQIAPSMLRRRTCAR